MKPVLLRRPSKAHVVMVDVHDTLLVHRDGQPIPYEDADAQARELVPHERAVNQVRAMEESGFDIMFLSGAPEAQRAVLAHLLEEAGLRGVSERLILQDEWQGLAAMRDYKRDMLLDWGAVLLVGDHAMDQEAAQSATCAFLHVDAFVQGGFHHLFCWTCGHNDACRGFPGWATSRECRTCTAKGNALLDEYAAGVRDPPFEEDPAERDPANLRDPLEAWL